MAQVKVGSTDPELLKRVAALWDNPASHEFFAFYNPFGSFRSRQSRACNAMEDPGDIGQAITYRCLSPSYNKAGESAIIFSRG